MDDINMERSGSQITKSGKWVSDGIEPPYKRYVSFTRQSLSLCLEQKFNRFVTSDMDGKLRNREDTFLGTCICKTWNISKIVEIALIGIVALICSGFLTKQVITRVYKSFLRSSSRESIQTSQL